MADTEATRSYESATETSQKSVIVMVLFSIGLNMILSGILSLLVGMINSLQLIIHLPMMNVPFPANAMTFVRCLVPIVMFEILEYKDILLDFLNGDEKEIEYI